MLGLAAAESVLELPSLEGLVSPHSYVTSCSDHGQDLGSAFPPPPSLLYLACPLVEIQLSQNTKRGIRDQAPHLRQPCWVVMSAGDRYTYTEGKG